MAIINMDVDNVVADFVPGLFRALEERGFNPGPLDHPDLRTWQVLERLEPETQKCAFEILAEPDHWLSLPLVPYAQEAITALREDKHHIQWVTTPWKGCYGWANARADWLDQYFHHPKQDLNYDLTVTGRKENIWADVFVDDKPSHIIQWHKNHPFPRHRAILYRTHYNFHDRGDLDNIEWDEESVKEVLAWLATAPSGR